MADHIQRKRGRGKSQASQDLILWAGIEMLGRGEP